MAAEFDKGIEQYTDLIRKLIDRDVGSFIAGLGAGREGMANLLDNEAEEGSEVTFELEDGDISFSKLPNDRVIQVLLCDERIDSPMQSHDPIVNVGYALGLMLSAAEVEMSRVESENV